MQKGKVGMKTVILAGGYGSRISEETYLKPKPLIEIGGMPILWHIMKTYSSHDINDFVICCGYKGYLVKEYFANYFLHMSDVTFDIMNNKMEALKKFFILFQIFLCLCYQYNNGDLFLQMIDV